MKQMKTIALIFLIAIGSFSCSSTGNAGMKYNVDLLQQDFAQFRIIIEDKTAGLYADRDLLEQMLERAEAEVRGRMSELEFYRLLAPIVANLRCGHSFLSVSEATEEFMRTKALFFPLEVRIIEDRLFVTADRFLTGVQPGSEIISINSEPSKDVISAITANMPTDGRDKGRPRYDAERWFSAMYFSYIGSPEVFTLELFEPGTFETARVRIAAVREPSLAKTSKGVIHDTADRPSSLTIKDSYALLKIRTFSYSNPGDFKQFLESSFSEIKERKSEVLILDLRGNYGGTPVTTNELFKYIIEKPLPFFAGDNPFYLAKWKNPTEPSADAFRGKLYILMDEACFSMNSFLISLVKCHNLGVLVGAPSSGGFMCSDASRDTVLSNTGLRLRYSTDVFKTAVEGQESGIGIMPDQFIDWSIEDYLEGNDPVLSAALQDAGI